MSPRRVRALVWKELLQVGRDPSSILIALVLPLLLLFIFGYGISLDSRHVPVGVVVEGGGGEADAFVAALAGSPFLSIRRGHDARELDAALRAGELRGIVVLPADFDRKVAGGEAAAQVITDGTEPQIASFVTSYVRGALAGWQDSRASEAGVSPTPPIEVRQRVWYNPGLVSRAFLVPGSIAIILTVVGALLTALVIAREWERGTMEALLASPVTRGEFLLGKVLPYFGLGLASFSVCVVAAIFVFDVPLRGGLFALYLAASLFLLGGLGLGLAISAVTKNQFLASQAAINAAFLPAFMLSGFIFEIRSMPAWIQMIARAVPARYLVESLKTLFLVGDVWPFLLPRFGALALIATAFLALVALKLERHLD
jgi:ABC-2 type transport system permease protein